MPPSRRGTPGGHGGKLRRMLLKHGLRAQQFKPQNAGQKCCLGTVALAEESIRRVRAVNPSNKPKPADKPIDCEVLKKFTTCDRSFYPGDRALLSPSLAQRLIGLKIVQAIPTRR